MSRRGGILGNLFTVFKSCTFADSTEELEDFRTKEFRKFEYKELVSATKNFNPDLKLGQGGFGSVFKGKLKDGREIAVKKLSQMSNQGAKEFVNEARVLLKVQHRNVVALLGYCSRDPEKLLVYEFVPNDSVDKFLFNVDKRMQLDWKRRHAIILGVARGLLYLHCDSPRCIIHRDIKASNILIDENWTPKIADFGMARLFPEDLTQIKTRVAGTNGYMAPEYMMQGQLSDKADVFSYGVLVLELVSGKKNSTFHMEPDVHSLLEWAWKLHSKGRSIEIMDPLLMSSADMDQVASCINVGLLCTQSDPKLRPIMQRVLVLLSRKPGDVKVPIMPSYAGSMYQPHLIPGENNLSLGWASHSGPSNAGSTSASGSSTSTANTSSKTSSTRHSRGKRPMYG